MRRPGRRGAAVEDRQPSPAAAAHRREIRQREPDERCAQNREPRDAIERRIEGARQRFEIAHDGHVGQRLEIHADERHVASASAARTARRWGRALASTAIDSSGRDRAAAARSARRRRPPRSRPAARRARDAIAAARPRGRRARETLAQVAHRAAAHVVGAREDARERARCTNATSAGAERKLRRSSSGSSGIAPSPPSRTVENRPTSALRKP